MYECWSDASVKPSGTKLSYVIKLNDEILVKEVIKLDVITDSNLAEYMALYELIKEIKKRRLKEVKIYTDSKNVVYDLKRRGGKYINTYMNIRKDVFKVMRKCIKIEDIKWKRREFNIAHI